MRVTVQYGLKVPGDEDYSSRQHSVAIELEPPPEVAQDKEKLAAYLASITAEVRARVEAEIGVRGTRTAPPPRPLRASATSVSRSVPGRAAPRSMAPAARREPGDDSHESNGQSASPKQVNFLRSLGQQKNLSYGQVSALAEETFGKRDLRDLTKKEASALIDQLRSEAA